MYEQEEMDTLLKACNDEERLRFEFFLMTGMREREVMYTYWSDVNFSASTVRVSDKADRNWTPKAYKEREIPIPAKLTKKLKTWKAKADKTCNLVFPTSGCNPKLISSAVGKRVPNVQNSTRTTFGYTSFVRHLRRGACGPELICAPCSNGWDTPT